MKDLLSSWEKSENLLVPTDLKVLRKGFGQWSTRGVQPEAPRPHAAQGGCEWGPTQNLLKILLNITYLLNLLKILWDDFVITCHNVFSVAQDNSSSSSVAQRHQKVGHPWNPSSCPSAGEGLFTISRHMSVSFLYHFLGRGQLMIIFLSGVLSVLL